MVNKRNTIQRKLIFDAVRELNIHATAEQVFEHVVKFYPSVSKATVYRNLSQMADSGELLNAGNFAGSTHYDHNTHDHYHFGCDICKAVFDVEGVFPDIMGNVKKSDDFEITGYNIIFHGICKACRS